MKETLKELTIKYLKSLPSDIVFTTSKRLWMRDELIEEVENETQIGKEITEVNKKYLLS